MYPEVISLSPLTLRSYGLLIAIGVFLSLFWMTRAARKFGFPPEEKVFDLVFVVVISGFLGARLFYVVQEWSWYRTHPLEVFQIWKGGLVYYGGMVASFIGFYCYVRLVRLPFLASSDFVIPYIALSHAFGRVGCFLNGCCYGKVCDFPWAVKFPSLPEPVHPTQLYEAVFNLALFGFLAWLYARRRFAGEVTFFYLIVYGVGRFLLEFFRGDQTPWFYSLTLHQVLSLGFILMGILFYFYEIRGLRR